MSLFEKTIDTEIINNFVSIGLQWLFLTKFILSTNTILNIINYKCQIMDRNSNIICIKLTEQNINV